MVGAAVGVVALLGALTLGLVFRQHYVGAGAADVYRTLLGYAMAATAGSLGAGVGSLVASSDRCRGEGEFVVTTALGIIAIIGLAMGVVFAALYFAAPTPRPARSSHSSA